MPGCAARASSVSRKAQQNECATLIERLVASGSTKGQARARSAPWPRGPRLTWARRIAAVGEIWERPLRCACKVGASMLRPVLLLNAG